MMILKVLTAVIASLILLTLVACPAGNPPADTQTGTPAASGNTTDSTTPPSASTTPSGVTETETETPPVTSTTPEQPKYTPVTPLPEGWPTDLTLVAGFEIIENAAPTADGTMILKARQIEGAPSFSGFDLADYYSTQYPGWVVVDADQMKFTRTDFSATIPITKGDTRVEIKLATVEGNVEEITFTLTKTS
ncbi:MAG: hypothetical protein NTY09_13160 [bacterium]|nr:hypothetical protein [bacterium]